MGFPGGRKAPRTIVEKLGFDPARMMGVLFVAGLVSIRPDAYLPAEGYYCPTKQGRLSPSQRRHEIAARLTQGIPQTVIAAELGITRSTLWLDMQALKDCGKRFVTRRGRASWAKNRTASAPC